MAEISSRGLDCDDCEGERGKRGKRGHRGHDGHDGAAGATGPAGSIGPAGTTGSSILWAPDGGGDATTWAEVMAFVAASAAPLNIYVDSNTTIPPGVYSMKGSGFISSPIIGSFLITMADGAQLENLGFVEGQMVLEANATALTPLVFNAATGGSPNALLLRFNGALRNNGSIPMIEVPSGTFFVLGMILNATLLVPGAVPIVNANGPGTAIIAGIFGTATLNNNWVTGPVGSTLLYQNLGGVPSPLPTNAGFLGATIQNLLLGVSCTGPAARPANPFGALPIGAMVFDQSLGATGKPIWWDGTQWVDATGTPA